MENNCALVQKLRRWVVQDVCRKIGVPGTESLGGMFHARRGVSRNLGYGQRLWYCDDRGESIVVRKDVPEAGCTVRRVRVRVASWAWIKWSLALDAFRVGASQTPMSCSTRTPLSIVTPLCNIAESVKILAADHTLCLVGERTRSARRTKMKTYTDQP